MRPTIQQWMEVYPWITGLKDGEKLIKSKNYHKHFLNDCPYRSEYSFIKINGTLYAIDNDSEDRVLGEGSFGTVKRGYTFNGKQVAIKIVEEDESDEYELKDVRVENEIAVDVGLSLGHASRQRLQQRPLDNGRANKKHYTVMPVLASNFADFLFDYNNGGLKSKKRLDLAIQCCLRVYELHEGKKSKQGILYAHLDIKPENFMFSDRLNIKLQLIDYGFSESAPFEPLYEFKGTAIYLPPKPIGKIKAHLDILALKRTLYLTKKFDCPEFDKGQRDDAKDVWVLPDQLVKEKKLGRILSDDLSKMDEHTPAIEIAAHLILAYYDLENPDIKPSKAQCLKLAQAYQQRLPKEEIESIAREIKVERPITPALKTHGLFAKPAPKATRLCDILKVLHEHNHFGASHLFYQQPTFASILPRHAANGPLIGATINYLKFYQEPMIQNELTQTIEAELKKLLNSPVTTKTLIAFKQSVLQIVSDAGPCFGTKERWQETMTTHARLLNEFSQLLMRAYLNTETETKLADEKVQETGCEITP